VSTERESLTATRRITVWVCVECDYWRKEKSTGVHQTFIPASHEEAKRTGNRNVIHHLREMTFIEDER
jgi:hypothetical protein